AEPASVLAQEESMMHTLFHWGLHPWGVYAIVGLTLAYFNFRHNAPLLMSSALSPLIGDRSKGWLVTGIDSLAVFGTIYGIATSHALHTTQITARLRYSIDGNEHNI